MKIPEPRLSTLLSLLSELLDLIDTARSVHDVLFETYGENDQTLASLEELGAVREASSDLYRRVSALMLNVARLDADRGAVNLKALTDALSEVSLRIGPLRQSIREVRDEWRLP